jgi:hypothetical protein
MQRVAAGEQIVRLSANNREDVKQADHGRGFMSGSVPTVEAGTGTRFFSDMDACEPASALSATPKVGAWRLIPYETDLFAGHMLVAAHETAAPEVRYRLDVEGWHRISIGVYQERWDEIEALQVKLSGDEAFVVLTVPSGPQWVFYDVYWKTADVTGQDIVFRQLSNVWDEESRPGIVRRPSARTRIAYIKLEPLTEDEVVAYRADLADPEHKRLFAHGDSHGFMWLWGARKPEDIYRELEPFRESDFSRYYWEAAMGDLLYYLGKAGRLPTCDGIDDFQNNGGRMHAENWRWFRDTGFDPLRLAVDYAHRMGLELHAGYRPAGFAFPPPEDQWNAGGFYEHHPELRAINRDRSLAPRTSYTFPETRRKVLSILREIAEYGVDGIAIIYIRRPPLVGYEPPIVDAFRAETGRDAHELAADDERWLRFRCRVLNEFMREVRAELDAVGREQGRTRPIEITAMVSGRWDENLLHGQDVAQWVADGTVDTLIPYTMAPELDSGAEAWPDPADADAWINLVRGTKTKLSLSILPRWKSAEDYDRKARQLYARGAESLFFWDCGGQRANFMDQFAWNALKRLGHRDAVLARRDVGEEQPGPEGWGSQVGLLAVPTGEPSGEVITRPVLDIGGYDMRFGTPG